MRLLPYADWLIHRLALRPSSIVYRRTGGTMPDSLEQVAAEVAACRKCPLGGSRKNAVPGEGPADARIMCIGEGPGFHEDLQGRPFVGASGQYLEELLAEIKLTRKQVYIANVIKCRPPGNRDPEPAELAACRDYLDRQIALIKPSIIVTLGRYSMERYFPGQSISRIHGRPKRVGDVYYLPMFHPAAALRNPAWRREMSADMGRIPALLAEIDAARAQREPQPEDESGGNFEQLSLF
jgi:uracil-DNA glycosylase